jgi:AcrR family transcriptional regulator
VPVKVPNTSKAAARPRGRRTKDMPEGRQALLRAATQAFANNGFEGADIRSIAAAAGVSPNLVRVHFGSKADLWEACLDAVVAAATPTMIEVSAIARNTQCSLYERLRKLIVRVVTFFAAHPEVSDFVARHGIESPKRTKFLTERLLRPAYETTRELFAAGIEAGIIRSSHPAMFFAVFNGAVKQPSTILMLLDRLAPEIDRREGWQLMIETIVETFLHRPASEPASGSRSSRLAAELS